MADIDKAITFEDQVELGVRDRSKEMEGEVDIEEENLDLNTTNAGVTSTYVVSVVPTVQVISGVAVTVGSGKTMVIDVLQLGGR